MPTSHKSSNSNSNSDTSNTIDLRSFVSVVRESLNTLQVHHGYSRERSIHAVLTEIVGPNSKPPANEMICKTAQKYGLNWKQALQALLVVAQVHNEETISHITHRLRKADFLAHGASFESSAFSAFKSEASSSFTLPKRKRRVMLVRKTATTATVPTKALASSTSSNGNNNNSNTATTTTTTTTTNIPINNNNKSRSSNNIKLKSTPTNTRKRGRTTSNNEDTTAITTNNSNNNNNSTLESPPTKRVR